MKNTENIMSANNCGENFKHTPGPWHVVNEDGKPVVKSSDDFYITNTIDAAGYESDDDTRFFNARLIAAAPDLLKALNAMLTHMGMDEDEWNKQTFDQARAAITKATGGEA